MSIDEITNEISRLEEGETNWTNIQKLAWLYTVQDHLSEDHPQGVMPESYTVKNVPDVMPEYDGEFGQAVSGVDIEKLMKVLSEHMDVVKVLYPKEYQAVIDRIGEIP